MWLGQGTDSMWAHKIWLLDNFHDSYFLLSSHEISHPYSSLMNYSNIVTEYKYVLCSSTEEWPILWWSVVSTHIPRSGQILTTKIRFLSIGISPVVLDFLSQKFRAKLNILCISTYATQTNKLPHIHLILISRVNNLTNSQF